ASTGSQAGLLGLGAAALLAVGGALFLSARRRKGGHA
ncbi:LPXTG cell wall anchor domain-containing protein, partial [Streptomyces katrae]